jgi:hypothetical protein
MPDVPWFSYWNLDKAFLYMPIYAVGNCCHGLVEKFRWGPAVRSLLWLALAAVGLGFLIVAPLNIARDVAYVLAPVAVILVLQLYTAVSRSCDGGGSTLMDRIARVVAINGITYLALQNYLIGIIKIVASRALGPEFIDAHGIVMKVVIALVVMAVLYPLAIVVDRYFPFLLGKSRKRNNQHL